MHVLIPALHRPIKPTGVCRHAANLAQCLVAEERVSRVTLLVGKWQRTYFKQSFNLESHKIQLISVDIKNSSLSRNQWFIFGLPRLAQQLQPDIVHMSFPFPFVRQWFKAPTVSTIHDLYPYECPENFGYPQVLFNQLFLRQCVRSSDGLSCVSKSTLEALRCYFPQVEQNKKTEVIYNYVDFSQVYPKFPESTALKDNPPFLLCVAQHRKNKNLDLLIKAYAQLMKKNNLDVATKLVLIGSPGPETENLQTLVQTLNLQDQVILLNSLNDGELCWLYKNCKLFVIPSSTEGFCLPLVEALVLGCKVVCSDIPIFREVGSSICTYFDVTEQPVNNLARAIADSLSHPVSNLSSIDLRFSREYVTHQLLDFYSLLL